MRSGHACKCRAVGHGAGGASFVTRDSESKLVPHRHRAGGRPTSMLTALKALGRLRVTQRIVPCSVRSSVKESVCMWGAFTVVVGQRSVAQGGRELAGRLAWRPCAGKHRAQQSEPAAAQAQYQVKPNANVTPQRCRARLKLLCWHLTRVSEGHEEILGFQNTTNRCERKEARFYRFIGAQVTVYTRGMAQVLARLTL